MYVGIREHLMTLKILKCCLEFADDISTMKTLEKLLIYSTYDSGCFYVHQFLLRVTIYVWWLGISIPNR